MPKLSIYAEGVMRRICCFKLLVLVMLLKVFSGSAAAESTSGQLSAQSPQQVSQLPELNYLRANSAFQAQWQPKQNFQSWQQQARQLLRQSYLGPSELPAIKAELQSREDMGQWLRERWRVQLVLPVWQEVWLLRPKAKIGKQAVALVDSIAAAPIQQYPAVLLLHDHGAEFRIGKEKWFSHSEKMAISQPWSQRYFEGEFFADKLAAAGFIVLAGDAPGFGQRGPLHFDQQQQLAANMQAQGYSLAGMIALEDLQMAQFLKSQAEVDPLRVSAVGFSFGAYRVWQLAALSSVIQKAVGVGWFNELNALRTADGNFSKGQSSWLMIHPGLFKLLDIADIAALAAPKPLLIINGAKDPLMPAAGWLGATRRLCDLYNEAQKNGCQQLETKLWENEGHVFSLATQQLVIAFLKR